MQRKLKESLICNRRDGTDFDKAVRILINHYSKYLENSAVATGLEKVSFHPNPKERQLKKMLKLPHSCTHLTR